MSVAASNIPYTRLSVPIGHPPDTSGSVIAHYFRDLWITLQGHPSILPVDYWNVDLVDAEPQLYSVIFQEPTTKPVTTFLATSQYGDDDALTGVSRL
jgi:hypothetical protein